MPENKDNEVKFGKEIKISAEEYRQQEKKIQEDLKPVLQQCDEWLAYSMGHHNSKPII